MTGTTQTLAPFLQRYVTLASDPSLRMQAQKEGKLERRSECIEALRHLAKSDDTNRDEVVRIRVKDCIAPEASDLRQRLQGLSDQIDAETAAARPGEAWNYAKVFVQSMRRYMDTEMVDAPTPKAE